MIVRNLFFVLLIIAFGCKEKAVSGSEIQESTQEEVALPKAYTIEEIFAFAKAKTLENYIPEDQILETKNWIADSSIEIVTLKLYPNTPKELLINYADISKSNVESIEVYAYDSPWKSNSGIYMGMSLADLERLNGKPISFYGYEWDNAGAIDFEKGALETKNLFAYLGTDSDVQFSDSFIGDKRITSIQAKESEIDFKVTGLRYNPN